MGNPNDDVNITVTTEEKYPDRREEHRTEPEPTTVVEVEGDDAVVEVNEEK